MYTPDGNVQQDLAYLYDLAGNIIGIRDKAPANSSAEGPGNLLKQFAYDPLNRLLNATGRESTQAPVLPEWDTSIRNHDHTATNTYTRAYQFDKLGNVLQEQHTADGNSSNSFTKTFAYHATQEHNKLLSFTVGGNTYDQSYDACGNLTGDDTSRVYAWGYDDKLRFFSLVPGPSSSKIAHYLYDSSGTRIKKVVNKPSGKQEVTVYIDGVFEYSYTKDSGTPAPADLRSVVPYLATQPLCSRRSVIGHRYLRLREPQLQDPRSDRLALSHLCDRRLGGCANAPCLQGHRR